jgi:hypothetical protein
LQLLGQGKHRLSPVVMPFPWGQAMPRRIPAPLWIFIGSITQSMQPTTAPRGGCFCETGLAFQNKCLVLLTCSYLLL